MVPVTTKQMFFVELQPQILSGLKLFDEFAHTCPLHTIRSHPSWCFVIWRLPVASCRSGGRTHQDPIDQIGGETSPISVDDSDKTAVRKICKCHRKSSDIMISIPRMKKVLSNGLIIYQTPMILCKPLRYSKWYTKKMALEITSFLCSFHRNARKFLMGTSQLFFMTPLAKYPWRSRSRNHVL